MTPEPTYKSTDDHQVVHRVIVKYDWKIAKLLTDIIGYSETYAIEDYEDELLEWSGCARDIELNGKKYFLSIRFIYGDPREQGAHICVSLREFSNMHWIVAEHIVKGDIWGRKIGLCFKNHRWIILFVPTNG